MSYLSASGNVGFGGISQISDTSCASQYKICSEGAGGGGGGGGEEEELAYLPSVSEHLFNSKFKLEPEELYTFQDSDGVAGEITVGEHAADPPHGLLTNGHYTDSADHAADANAASPRRPADDLNRSDAISDILASVGRHSPAGLASALLSASPDKCSIISVTNEKPFSSTSCNQSFLDVFKREMGSFGKLTRAKEADRVTPSVNKADVKHAFPKKLPSGKGGDGGRGPALHEALQRIPPAPPPPPPLPPPPGVSEPWHAPGPHRHDCLPLTDKKHRVSLHRDSSDDDADMPSFGAWVLTGADDAEAGGGDARGARLAARRATLRRQVAHAATALRLAPSHRQQARLAHTIKRHLSGTVGAAARLPTAVVSQLLASRDMPTVLSNKERRRLRGGGWSGAEAGAEEGGGGAACAAEGCAAVALPCARYCLAHVTLAPEQRLYASCAAVFAGGARCRQPLLHLHDQTPLCAEHAWKRDNYDKISRETRDCKPKKVTPRKRPSAATARRPARRRRPPPAPRAAPPPPPPPPPRVLTPTRTQPHQEVNVCSNSSTYDSSEDTGIGGFSDTEFMVATAGDHTSLDVGVVEEVLAAQQAPDDILDAAVLHQIPDEAFTDFFNQPDGGDGGARGGGGDGGFAESEELARALEAVLDERALDSLADCVFTHASHHALQPAKVLSPSLPPPPHGLAESEELARALEAVLDERALDSLADCVFTHASHHALQPAKVPPSSLAQPPHGLAESEELARALEAVLDERALDSLADCVFTHTLHHALQPAKVPPSSLAQPPHGLAESEELARALEAVLDERCV